MKLCSLTLLSVLLCFSLKAQKVQFRNFNVKEGLGQSQVYDVTEDKKGQLWLATRGGGISIYNGLNFRSLNHRNGLSNDFVYCFLKDPQQNIWIGTNDGLNLYDGKLIRKFYPENLGEQIWILKMDMDKQHRLWLATKIGLVKFENGKFENVSEKLHLSKIVCNAVYVDGDSFVYWGNDYGLFRTDIRNGYNKAEKITYGTTDPSISITKLLRTEKGTLLAGSYGYGLFKVEDHHLVRFLDTAVNKQEKILDLYEDRQTLYIATMENGIWTYNFQSRKLEQTGIKKGLSNNHVRKIYKDRHGSFWFGTSGGGVSNFGGQLFTHFDQHSGLPDNFIYTVLQTTERKVWVGTGKGLALMSGDSIVTFNSGNGFINTKVRALKEYSHDYVLIGTEGEGLYIHEKDSFRFVAQLGRQFIKDIAVDHAGSIWIATAGNGIYRLKPENTTLQSFDIRQFIDHIINPRVQFLNTQLPGKVFYCTENQGIGMIEKEQESGIRLNTRTGLPSNLTRSITIDRNGIAWIATSDKGIAAYNLTEKKPLAFDNTTLSSLNIYLLKTDKNGNLVIGTERGLDHVFLDKRSRVTKVKHYGKGEGFLGIETCLNAVNENTDGSFWIGTIEGLSLYNPAKGTLNPNAPMLSLSDIRLFYKPVAETKFAQQLASGTDGPGKLVLPYNQNHLTFDFLGVNISNGEGVLYKWKLENFDDRWSPASNQHTVTYSNLPPGVYTLLINACNEDGVWSKKPLKYTFEIKKPFWMEWWFLALAVLLLVLAVYKIIQWRTRVIRKEADEKQRELQLAHQLQTLEHKALRLQMNPHFIFNALNSIQSQIGNNNDQEARYYMAKFGKLMRQILNHSEQTWVNISEELEMIENYLLIEQFCHNKQFTYQLDVDPGLMSEEYKIPSMIIQPFIENAIKHGFRNLKERDAVLTLRLSLQENSVACIIEDNGVGRPAIKEQNTEQHQSMAIAITQKRLQLLHEDTRQQFVTITDLSENGKPAGTRVFISLPMQ